MPNSSSRPPGKSGPRAAAGEHVEANQTVEGAVQHGRRQDRRGRHRRFAVGVGLPGVHRSEARLGPVSEQGQDEGQPQGRLVQLRGARGQEGPVQPGQSVGARQCVPRVVGENGAEQRHRQADAADDRVLPGGLERGGLPVESDQEDRRERGGFNRHPHDAQVIGHGDEQHREHEQRRQGVVPSKPQDGRVAVALPGERPAALVVAQIAHGVDRARKGHRGGQQNHQGAQMVGVEEAVPQGHGPARQHLAAQEEGQQKDGSETGQVDRLHGGPFAGQVRQNSGSQGDEK